MEIRKAVRKDVPLIMAFYFHNFSTFVGKGGLYLEDLFVLPEHRGKGYGKALFLHLVDTARKRNCGRMEWVCLWLEPAEHRLLSLDGSHPLRRMDYVPPCTVSSLLIAHRSLLIALPPKQGDRGGLSQLMARKGFLVRILRSAATTIII